MNKLLLLTLTLHWERTLGLHKEGCFSVNATFSCNEPWNHDHANCDGSYTYSYQYNTSTYKPLKQPLSIQILLSCSMGEYIQVASDMEYILQYKYKDYCVDKNRDCLADSSCLCCTKPSNNLCTIEAQVLDHQQSRCNESRVQFCEIEVTAMWFGDAEWMSCIVGGSGRDYGCILSGQTSDQYWCYARWARIYYNCLPRATQGMAFNIC